MNNKIYMEKLTLNNFFSKYIFHPLSTEISADDRRISLRASISLGILTAGLVHLGIACYQWGSRKFEQRTQNTTEQDNRTQRVQQNALPINKSQLAEAIRKGTRLIEEGRKHCTPEQIDEFDRFLQHEWPVNTTATYWLNGNILHCLAKEGGPMEFLPILAKHGVDFNQQDNWKDTPLLWAIANANNSMAFEILDYKQNLDLQGHGNGPLHLAIVKGYNARAYEGNELTISNATLAHELLTKGANPNLKNKMGYTAMHFACIRRDPKLIQDILRHGGDPSILAPGGKTCQDLLMLDFDEAYKILHDVTWSFFLPIEKFTKDSDANLIECCRLLSGRWTG